MTDRIVIITGGRDLTDPAPIHAFLDEQLTIAKTHLSWLVVYHGNCPDGADRFAAAWTRKAEHENRGACERPFTPNRADGYPAAYHIRNRKMVTNAAERRDKHEATVVAGAFPGERNGSRNTIKLLAKAGIETRVVEGCR